jgi:putative thioredoxin
MSPTQHVVDVDIRNFEQVVLNGSTATPVLVDFWATWCEPCKALGPTLERLAEEMDGAFLLAKVDIDANPEIAQAFRIQSVPTVVLIANGQPIDAFAGAKSAADVRAFLERHVLPASMGSPVKQARELEAVGELATAIGLLAEWLEEHAEDGEARALLAGLLLTAEDVPGAREHYAQLDEEQRTTPEAQRVAARLGLLENAGDVEALRAELAADPRDVGKRLALGRALIAALETEAGLEELLEAAMRDLHFEDDAPRKALIEVFQALGPEDPLTLEFQQRLSVLLCS